MKGDKNKVMVDYNLDIDDIQDYPYPFFMNRELLLDPNGNMAADWDFETASIRAVGRTFLASKRVAASVFCVNVQQYSIIVY